MKIQEFYDKVYNWVLTFGPRILIAIAILIAGQWFIRVFRTWLAKVLEKRKLDLSLKPFLQSLLATAMQVLLFFAIMQVLGIQLTVFAALVGGLGVAAGLALSGTLQNFTSGILILLLRPYRIGDNIIAQGHEGTVASIQIFYTLVTTFDHRTVIIPNSKLSNEVIVNLSREGKRRLDLELKFGFQIPFEEIRDIIQKSIDSVPPEVLKEPRARIGISSIDADGYKVMVNAWVKPHGFVDSRFSFQEKIIRDLKVAGIKLPGM
jgi:small conductance mechanosensitive channel